MTEEEMEVYLEMLMVDEIGRRALIKGDNIIYPPEKKGGQDDSIRLHGGYPESKRRNQDD